MAKPTADLHSAPDRDWHCASLREPVIRRLAALPAISDAEMRAASVELSLNRSQIYLLVARYRANSVASALMPMPPGPPKGQLKLGSDVERLIDRLIREVYLTRQKPKIAALCRAVTHECIRIGLPPPSRTAVAARVRLQKASASLRAREGKKAADDLFRPAIREYRAEYALQVVQIDHTPIDQIVVDDRHRQPLGRPWLTIAIDIASRMVTGFYVTLGFRLI